MTDNKNIRVNYRLTAEDHKSLKHFLVENEISFQKLIDKYLIEIGAIPTPKQPEEGKQDE